MSNLDTQDTEFGEFVFNNDLTTFEALSRLDVTNLGNEVTSITRELEQTRSELNDVSVALDTLIVRVNTDGFRISDLETQVQTQQSMLSQLNSDVQSAVDLATQAQSIAQSAQTTADRAQTEATDARSTADSALLTANATQTALGQTNSELSNVRTVAIAAQTTATAAQTTADNASNSASTALSIGQRAQQYLNSWPTIASLGAPIYCYVQNSQWMTVTLIGSLGNPVMTETGYSGQIVIRSTAGAISTSSWTYIAFSAIGNFASNEPLRLRSGNWQLRYGTSSVGSTTANVLVQDYVNTSI